jgi:CRP/FNR family cyclic AMP-dependent transcriptional regulator
MRSRTPFDGVKKGCAPEALVRHMKEFGRPLTIRAGQMVVLHGARDQDIYYIESGAFEVALTARDGQAVIVRDLGPGEIFGDFAAIVEGPRSASVVAADVSRIFAISESRFFEAIAQQSESNMWFIRRLAQEITRLTEKVFELAALSARDRLHCELHRLCVGLPIADGKVVVVRPPTHETIAMRIGSQRETVSREMSKLSNQGIVQKRRQGLVVDLDRLSAQVTAEFRHSLSA